MSKPYSVKAQRGKPGSPGRKTVTKYPLGPPKQSVIETRRHLASNEAGRKRARTLFNVNVF